MDGPTGFAALPPSRFALWRDKSPRQEGRDLLLLERVCGDAVEEREEVVPILHRDDTTEFRGHRLRWVSGRPGACAEAQRYLPTAQVGRQREA